MDETIYYIKQFYQEQVSGQATLLEHPHIIDPFSAWLMILTMMSYSLHMISY
jgi:hypothetical protein